MKKLAVSSLLSLFLLSCAVSAPNNSDISTSSRVLGTEYEEVYTKYNFAELEKEYKSFNTKALSNAYVQRMLTKFLVTTPTPTQVIRQLEFARYLKLNSDTSYFDSIKTAIANDNSILTKINNASGVPEKKSAEPATFGSFVNSLNPVTTFPIIYYVGNGSGEIWGMNSDGSNKTKISNGPAATPVYNNTKTKVAFQRSGNIWIMDTDGTNELQLTTTGGDSNPAFSPDGTKIAFQSGSPSADIYTVNADGTNRTRITNGISYCDDPEWSIDGTKIIISSQVGTPGTGNIVRLNVGAGVLIDNSNKSTYVTQITTNGSHTYVSGGYSPDGSKILYRYNNEIYSMNADGSNQTNLSNNAALDFLGRWSPDGAKVIFASHRTGDAELFVMNTDGSNQTNITNNVGITDYWPDWK